LEPCKNKAWRLRRHCLGNTWVGPGRGARGLGQRVSKRALARNCFVPCSLITVFANGLYAPPHVFGLESASVSVFVCVCVCVCVSRLGRAVSTRFGQFVFVQTCRFSSTACRGAVLSLAAPREGAALRCVLVPAGNRGAAAPPHVCCMSSGSFPRQPVLVGSASWPKTIKECLRVFICVVVCVCACVCMCWCVFAHACEQT
jgi:hypothetical protein